MPDSNTQLEARTASLEATLAEVTRRLERLSEEVVAKGFILQDSDGQPRARLSFSLGATRLEFLDGKGDRRLSLVSSEAESAIFVNDFEGIARIGLQVRPEG